MTQPTLTVEKHYLNWPLNRPLNQADIMHELGVPMHLMKRAKI